MSRNRRCQNYRRKNRKSPVQFMRGLIVESLGVAILIFLYVTIQASTSFDSVQTANGDAPSPAAAERDPASSGMLLQPRESRLPPFVNLPVCYNLATSR
jgi:hypothetical protein